MRKRSNPDPIRLRRSPAEGTVPRHGLARVLSKAGLCSRSHAKQLIANGRVSVDGKIVVDAERSTDLESECIAIDGIAISPVQRVYIALNKPRGIVVSTSDEQSRDTIYDLLEDAKLPWLAPVGRLDKASEGLLLLSNDPAWAARITDPATHLSKTYHVQVRGVPDAQAMARLRAGIEDRDAWLSARSVAQLRMGEKNAWLEIVLDEGRNRQIRRMLSALDHDVLRLMRVAIGPLLLGDLPKGQWRLLTAEEMAALAQSH